MSDITDELVSQVCQAQEGSAEALGWLVRHIQNRLYRFCLSLSSDPALAQDLCQDTLIKALESLSSLKEPGRFESWVFRCAKNQFLDHVKSPANKPAVSLDDPGDADGDGSRGPAVCLPGEGETPPSAETRLDVQRALEALPPADRLILLLVDLEGHSYAEAATVAGITESTLRFRLHHIRKAFVVLMNKQ